METQPTLDVMIADSIRAALTSDAIKKRVETAADKAITESINDAFGYSSEFRKSIQAKIKEVLPIIEARDLSTFSHAVRELLMRRLDTLASDTARVHLEEVIKQMIPDDPIIEMKDLKAKFIEKITHSNSDGCDCHEDYEPTYKWEIEKSSTDGYWDLTYSDDEDASRFSIASHTMRFRAIKDEPGLHQCWMINDREVVNKKTNGRTEMFAGPLYGFDMLVWRLASGTAKLKL